MRMPVPPQGYDYRDQSELRLELEREDLRNAKVGSRPNFDNATLNRTTDAALREVVVGADSRLSGSQPLSALLTQLARAGSGYPKQTLGSYAFYSTIPSTDISGLFNGVNTWTAVQTWNAWGTALGVGITSEVSNGTFGASGTINWLTNGQSQSVTTTTAIVCVIAFTAPPKPCWLTLKIVAPVAGTASNVTLPGKGMTSIPQVLGRTNIIDVYYDGVTYWNAIRVANA